MKARILAIVALTLVLAGSLSVSPAAADGAVVPFEAAYITHPEIIGPAPGDCNYQSLPGEGTATHLGLSTWNSDAIGCPATGTQSGTMTFTAANGDKLFGEFSGYSEFPTPGYVRFWGTYSITKGEGRLWGVTGTGTYEGTAELQVGGEGILYFHGTLTK